MVPSVNKIKDIVYKHNLKLINATLDNVDISVSSERETIDSFCEIAVENNIKTLFLNVQVFEGEELEDFLISDNDITEESYGLIAKEILKKIQEHNNKIKKLALEGPVTIKLFFILNGKSCALTFNQKWFLELNSPEEVLEEITLVYRDKIEKIKEDKESEQLENLINILVEDEEFKKCRGTIERRAHAQYVWEKGNNKFLSVLALEPYAKEAWEIVKQREKNNRYENLQKFSELLSKEENFKMCTNQQTRKAYVINFLKKYTKETFKVWEVEQIIEVARSMI